MKKLILRILSVTIIFLFGASSFAHAALASSSGVRVVGSLKDVRYSQNGGKDEIIVDLSSYSSYNVLRLKNPDRVVVDISGVDAPGGQQKIEVGGSTLISVRYAQFDKGIARVVLDVKGSPEYAVRKKIGGLIISLPGSGDKSADSDSDNGDTGAGGGDAPAGDSGMGSGDKDQGDSGLDAQEPDEDGADIRDEEPDAISRGGNGSLKVSVTNEFYIEHLARENSVQVALNLSNYRNYNVMRMTGPDRIVIDIPGVKLPASMKKVDIDRGIVKSIRYSQYGKNTARIVLDVDGQPQYSVSESKGRLALRIDSPVNGNFVYHNNGDRIYFAINGAKLTEGGETLKKLYTEHYDETGKKFTITFPRELANLKSGRFLINDGILESVRITNSIGKNTTSIVFTAKDRFTYLVFTRPEVKDTAITILKPAAQGEKLIVIDAGHGGREPGAVYGSLKEKDFNLDIARRLNNLLKEKKVKTFMIREDDRYVGLYERAYIANNLNASLFLSIHNNAMGDPNYGGTMTLHYPQRAGDKEFNGKVFARIIQDKLLGRLGTTDRRIIERPNLVVLKATTMPSSLAEVAFMTNSKDRSNLQKASFRQKAAQALCDAVLESLRRVK